MKILLASQSPYRKKLLTSLGIPFSVCAPTIDENDFKNVSESPKDISRKLAYEKVKSLHSTYPNHVIIGSDQLLDFEGQILNKPKNPKNAIEQLKFLSGKSHFLYTSLCVLNGSKIYEHINITELKMRNLNENQIISYVQKDNPVDCVGSYKLEEAGISLFESINTSDHSAIIGLPLIELSSILLKINPHIFS